MMRIFHKSLLTGVMTALGTVGLLAQTSPIYINHGQVDDAPQIDATAFYNDGVFDLFTDLPFTTLNTRHYTNRGTMVGGPGFLFSHDAGDQTGRSSATTFVNEGEIFARDSSGFGFITDPGGGNIIVPISGGASWLEVDATNVFASGLLSAGTRGSLKIKAKSVDLSRAGVRTGTLPNNSGFLFLDTDAVSSSRSNYINPSGITDAYWGVGTNQVLAGNGAPLVLNSFPPQLDIPFPVTPAHEVSSIVGSSNGFFVALPTGFDQNSYSAYVHTNSVGGSNTVIQVVYVATNINDGEITAGVNWISGAIGGLPPLNGSSTPIIEVSGRVFDTSLSQFITNSVYIVDQISSITNSFVAVNFLALSGRPANYRTAIGPPGVYSDLPTGNSRFNYFNHIWNFTWSFGVVTNQYTAYSFNLFETPEPTIGIGFVGNIPTRGFLLGNPFVENWFDPTNLPGRVTIDSDGLLDLESTRIRGENYTRVESPHVEFNSNTILDAPVLSLELGNTNGFMQINNAIPSSVDRLGGPVYVWSASWTNQNVTFQFDPETQTLLSNVTQILNYVTFVDGENIAGAQSVTTTELLLKSDELVLADDLFLQRDMKFDSSVLTLNSDIQIGPEVGPILGDDEFVGTVLLTNLGNIFQASGMELGPGYDPPLEVLHNEGQWNAEYFDILVDQLINDGTLFSYSGPLFAEAANINIESGEVLANNDVYLTGETLAAGLSTVRAGIVTSSGGYYRGKLHLNISDSVDDGGPGAKNVWDTSDGFRMMMKPATGDFAGTRLSSLGYQFREVKHKWGAQNRGMNASGWSDNATVGTLVLDGDILSLFTFETVDGNNAMYVENLDLRRETANNPADGINIEEGMTIYYSSANVDQSELAGVDRLVYFPMPTLPASTEITLANGQLFNANDNLLSSVVVDSDADGVVNGEDINPFDDVQIDVTVINDPEPQAVITWAGAPRTEYELQYKDDVQQDGWNTLTNFVTMSDQRDMTVTDDDPDSGHRYYRVIYTP